MPLYAPNIKTGVYTSGPDLNVGGLSNVTQLMPADSSIRLHLRADTGIVSNGSDISQWIDQSGYGNDFTMVSASKQPPLSSSLATFNNKDVVYFDRTSCLVVDPIFTGSQDAEIFLVLEVQNPTTSNSNWMHFNSNNNANTYPESVGNGDQVYDGFGSSTRHIWPVNGSDYIRGNTHIVNITSISGEYTARISGTQVFTSEANPKGWFAGEWVLGGYYNQSAFGQFYCGEVLMYDKKLSDDERIEAYNKVARRWGIDTI